MTERQPGPEPPLARLLLMASRWFDSRSLAELERRGWPRLTPAQSLLFAHLEEDGAPPAEVARRLGTTRQATHDLVKGLVQLELLVVRDNPLRRGGKLVCLTPRGRNLAIDAYSVLIDLEERLGEGTVRELRRLLEDLELDPGTASRGQAEPVGGGRSTPSGQLGWPGQRRHCVGHQR